MSDAALASQVDAVERRVEEVQQKVEAERTEVHKYPLLLKQLQERRDQEVARVEEQAGQKLAQLKQQIDQGLKQAEEQQATENKALFAGTE